MTFENTDTTATTTPDTTPSLNFSLSDITKAPKFIRHRHFETFKGYSKYALAEKTGLSYSYFTAILYGMAKPSKAVEAKIDRVANAVLDMEGMNNGK